MPRRPAGGATCRARGLGPCRCPARRWPRGGSGRPAGVEAAGSIPRSLACSAAASTGSCPGPARPARRGWATGALRGRCRSAAAQERSSGREWRREPDRGRAPARGGRRRAAAGSRRPPLAGVVAGAGGAAGPALRAPRGRCRPRPQRGICRGFADRGHCAGRHRRAAATPAPGAATAAPPPRRPPALRRACRATGRGEHGKLGWAKIATRARPAAAVRPRKAKAVLRIRSGRPCRRSWAAATTCRSLMLTMERTTPCIGTGGADRSDWIEFLKFRFDHPSSRNECRRHVDHDRRRPRRCAGSGPVRAQGRQRACGRVSVGVVGADRDHGQPRPRAVEQRRRARRRRCRGGRP